MFETAAPPLGRRGRIFYRDVRAHRSTSRVLDRATRLTRFADADAYSGRSDTLDAAGLASEQQCIRERGVSKSAIELIARD